MRGRVRFGAFELDPRAGEMHCEGQRVVLQEQQLKVLLMLIEREGEIVTREEIKRKLWPNHTVVEFDHGINNTIKNLRRALGDSAESPRYIESVARRGYRLMVQVEWIGAESALADSEDESSAESENNAPSSALSSRANPERKRGGVEEPAPNLPRGPAVDDSESLPTAKLNVGRLTGKVVSHYRVLEVIGGGGMGLVYQAEDLKLGRAVALKFLPEEVGDDPRARERFEREAKAVSALNHFNICTVYDFDEYEGLPFLVMELLQGKTLRDHLADGRFRLSQLEGLEIAIQIASGLEAAHEKGIIHRDIKPANIFITEKNVAKILDFGVAKVIQLSEPTNVVILSEERSDESKDPYGANNVTGIGVPRLARQRQASSLGMTDEIASDVGTPEGAPHPDSPAEYGTTAAAAAPAKSETTLTRTGMKLGTAGYMSPEQVRGEPLDARTDIFSFGLVLYEMASGERAFTGETEAILHDAIQHREPKSVCELVPGISPKLEPLIRKCLEKECEHRYQAMWEVANGLREVEQTLVPVPQINDAQKRTKLRRRRWVVMAVLAIALITVLSTALYRHILSRFRLTDKDTVVLADFENKTGDPVFDTSLTEALSVGLGQTPFLNLLVPDKVNRVVRDSGLSNEQPLTPDMARQVCLRTNSAVVVAGSISDAGNGYHIAVKALRCDTGAVTASASGVAEQRNEIVRELGRVAFQLREHLGESARTLQEFNQPLETATTSSVEALNWFTRGKQVKSKKEDDEAQPLFKRAIELDPKFALAHSSLAGTLWDDASRAERQRAYDLRDRVTKRQYFDLAGKYLEFVTGDLEQAEKLWREMAKTYPADPNPHYRLPITLAALGKYADSAAESREAIRLDPDAWTYYDQLMASEINMENYSEANSVYNEALSRGIDNIQLHHLRFVSALLEDDKVVMEKQLKWLRQSDPPWRMADDWVELSVGHLNNYRRSLLGELTADSTIRKGLPINYYFAVLAITEEELGDFTAAKEHAKAALTGSSERFVKVYAAYALARSGDLQQAQQRAEQLKAEVPNDTRIRNFEPCIRVAVAMNRNAMDEATNILRTSCPNNPAQPVASMVMNTRYLRGLVYLERRHAEEAAIAFQSVLDHLGENAVFGRFYAALAHLQLARAYAMMGDKDAARKSYQDFLTLWKDADPDIPIYRQAKAEYKKLQ